MTYIGEEFQKRFKTLPEDIQEALTAVASVDTIFAIGKKHGLMVDQIGKMADEIWKVMLGLANPKDFIRNLASVLGVESERASAIASEVNAQMFQMVRESLRRIYDQESGMRNKELDGSMSSLRPREAGEAIPQSKNEIASSLALGAPRNDEGKTPPMIYPQDRFEEEFKKEPATLAPSLRPREAGEAIPQSKNEIVSSSGRDQAPRNDEKKEPMEQLAPLPPAIIAPSKIDDPGSSTKEDFTYPEKMKDVHREPTIGNYKGRDPYREPTEE